MPLCGCICFIRSRSSSSKLPMAPGPAWSCPVVPLCHPRLVVWPLTLCLLCPLEGGCCQGDVHGLGTEQQQVSRVHGGQGGAALRWARREERQVLHQTCGLQGERHRGVHETLTAVEDLSNYTMLTTIIISVWSNNRYSTPDGLLCVVFFSVRQTKLCRQWHGVFTGLHQDRHRPVRQHHLCLQDRRGVVIYIWLIQLFVVNLILFCASDPCLIDGVFSCRGDKKAICHKFVQTVSKHTHIWF